MTAVLPGTLPTASLIGTFDDGEWIALVLTDVDGRHPRLAARRGGLVLDALLTVARTPVLPALGHLPDLALDVGPEPADGVVSVEEVIPVERRHGV
ncbi:hypothetical protein I6N91_11095 [Arthrobacter sp. MSA 4-2]|uniref:hypothetical protein n=1 Tax=Arthrobacter sp. MSA 4-2 TaxID=2794349 RepID=UPI0018E8B143|nr:hypothetical protein [Arthrobacter sp. MSA 4-2]MBJ2121523.1 hypothetical protein [Arthrobacter sp. MSA 4-2]